MTTSGRGRWWALGALAVSGLVIGIDVTVLNLALPTLATSLHAATAELQWFVAAYSLALAAAMIPAGMLGDRYGRKKLLLISLAVFGAASLACAYAPSSGALIAARATLGLAAAFITPLTLSVLPVLFSEQERGKAVTIIIAMTMVALPLGPILGGWLLTRFWWGSVFLINVPIVVIALIAVAVLLPESRSAKYRRLDPLGIISSSVGLAVLTYGVIEAGQHGWGSAGALAAMLAGAAIVVAFVIWERRVREPLIDLSLFRSPSFTWGTILLTTVSFAMFGIMFAAPQYFQAILGVNALGSGLRLLPMVGGLVVGAVIAERLAPRAGAKITVSLGFALLAAGLLAGAVATTVSSGEGVVAAWITVAGLGLGFAMPKAMDAALGALTAERSGVGSALLQAVRMVGGSFGAAILGSVLSSTYGSGLRAGPGGAVVAALPASVTQALRDSVFAGLAVAQKLGSAQLAAIVQRAFVHGMNVMLAASGGIALVGLVLALVFLPRRFAAAAAETAGVSEGGAPAGEVLAAGSPPARPPVTTAVETDACIAPCVAEKVESNGERTFGK
jgi:MFS transporter, DHA2 family, multidrug resistance protein